MARKKNRFRDLIERQQRERQGIEQPAISSLAPSSASRRPNRFRDLIEQQQQASSSELPSSSSFLQTDPSAAPLPPEPQRFPIVSPESRQLLKKIPITSQDVTAIKPKKEILTEEVLITARPDVTRLDPLIKEALGEEAFDKAFDQAIHGNALRIAQDATGKAVDRKAANKFLKFRRALEDIRKTSGDPNSSDGRILMKFINRRVARKKVLEERRFDPDEPGATAAAAFFPRVAGGVEAGEDFTRLFGEAIVDLITIPGGVLGAASQELAEAVAGTGGLPGATTFLETMTLRGTPAESPASELFSAPANVAAVATGPLLRGVGKVLARQGAERTGQFLQRAGSLGKTDSRVLKLRQDIDNIARGAAASESGVSAAQAILQPRTVKEIALSLAGTTGEFATAAGIPTLVELADSKLSGDELLPAQGAFMWIAGMAGEAASRRFFKKVDPQRFVRDLAGRKPEIRAALEMLASNKDQLKLIKKSAALPGEALALQLKDATIEIRAGLKRAGIEIGEAKKGDGLIEITSIIDDIDDIIQQPAFGTGQRALRTELQQFRADIVETGTTLPKAKRGGNGLEDMREAVFMSLEDLDRIKIAFREAGESKLVPDKPQQKIFIKFSAQANELAESSFASDKLRESFKAKKRTFGEIKQRLESIRNIIQGNVNEIEGKTNTFVRNMFDVEDTGQLVAKKPVDARNLKQFSDLNKEIQKFPLQERINDIKSGRFIANEQKQINKRLAADRKELLGRKDISPAEKSEKIKVKESRAASKFAGLKDPTRFRKNLEIAKAQRQIELIDNRPGLFEKAVANEFLERLNIGFPGSKSKEASSVIGRFFDFFLLPVATVARQTRQNVGFKLSQLLGLEISEETIKRAIPNTLMRQMAIEGLIWVEVRKTKNEIVKLKQEEQTSEIRQQIIENEQKIEDLNNQSAVFNTFGSENDLPKEFREFINMPDDESDLDITDGGTDEEGFVSGLLSAGVQKTKEFFTAKDEEIPDKLNGFGTNLNDFFPRSGVGGFSPENIVSFINEAAEKNHDNTILNLEEFKLLSQSVASRESAGNNNAVSSAGARGVMQIMNKTADKLGLSRGDMHKPAPNVDAGTRLLNELLNVYKSGGRQQAIQKALAAYNGGEVRVNEAVKAGGDQWRDFLAPDNLAADLEMNGFIDAVLGKFNSKVDLITAENGGVPGVGG